MPQRQSFSINQGGSISFFGKWGAVCVFPHTPFQQAEVTNSQPKTNNRILGTLPILWARCFFHTETEVTPMGKYQRQYRIILSADTASEVRQM
ncbi:MAG: hypothetical protein ACLR1L_10275, partial [Subdoligranulum sp.]